MIKVAHMQDFKQMHEKKHSNLFHCAIQKSDYYDRTILKLFLLTRLHNFIFELFKSKIDCYQNNYLMECYSMDSKMIQFVLESIVKSGNYTLEGIAHYTKIPLDVIFDAACGTNNQLSITFWIRIVKLYLQVKPDLAKELVDKLIELREKNSTSITCLLES